MPLEKAHPVEVSHDQRLVTLFLAGDVMTGRGVDQILPHPGDPMLFESYVKSATDYVALAEEANGAIPKPVSYDYVWGDALAELDRRAPDARLINLETAVTVSNDAQPKGINYRMHPDNAPVLAAAGIDCCVLANNHVLDWGKDGLVETLETLERIGIASAGAGHDLGEAEAPAGMPARGGRVLLFAFGAPTSGVPESWAACKDRVGVNVLPDLERGTSDTIAALIAKQRRPGDMIVVSLHWGGNWGYEITAAQQDFARTLIDEAGADIVWGHSSHHPKGIEVHNEKLILYGCGDFIDDYEGIRGYEEFRDDLVLMYFPTLRHSDSKLVELVMVPLQIRNFRLNRVARADAEWLANMLNREGTLFGTGVELQSDNSLVLSW